MVRDNCRARARLLAARRQHRIVARVLDQRRLTLLALHREAQRSVVRTLGSGALATGRGRALALVRRALAQLGRVAGRHALEARALGAQQARDGVGERPVGTRVNPRAQDAGRVLEVLALVDQQHLDVRVRSECAGCGQPSKASTENGHPRLWLRRPTVQPAQRAQPVGCEQQGEQQRQPH